MYLSISINTTYHILPHTHAHIHTTFRVRPFSILSQHYCLRPYHSVSQMEIQPWSTPKFMSPSLHIPFLLSRLSVWHCNLMSLSHPESSSAIEFFISCTPQTAPPSSFLFNKFQSCLFPYSNYNRYLSIILGYLLDPLVLLPNLLQCPVDLMSNIQYI